VPAKCWNSNSVCEIDAELEAAFDQMQEEREITGNISDATRERCVQLFAELGKKIDRIAAYLRTQQRKAGIAGEEAQRLQQRRRSAAQRVDDVKDMLTSFMRCRGVDWKANLIPFACKQTCRRRSRSTTRVTTIGQPAVTEATPPDAGQSNLDPPGC
jgi:hypothetical protein